MRKRLKKRVHMAIDCSPYCYQYFSYCRGMIRAQFMDFRKFNDDEKLVTCKACKKDIKRQNRLMQADRTTYENWIHCGSSTVTLKDIYLSSDMVR